MVFSMDVSSKTFVAYPLLVLLRAIICKNGPQPGS